MNIYSIKQLLSIAKFTSPIYQELYKDITPSTPFEKLPILSNERLMEIVHAKHPDFVFSEGNTHGLIFESSASTGKPKVTLCGRDEWETQSRMMAVYHWRNGLLKDRDRVANLCATPYLSFRIVHSVIENYPGKCSEVPIGCEMKFADLNDSIKKYECNVLAGINSTILGLAWDLLERGTSNKTVSRILAGGELLYGKQREVISRAFPNAVMVSFMLGTTESGMIGFSCLNDPLDVFRPYPGMTIVENIDEITGERIKTPNKRGKCVVTSLLRAAAPAIRMDTGDYIEWLDNEGVEEQRFRLLGRKFPFKHSLRGVEFSETEVWSIVKDLENNLPLLKFETELHCNYIEVVYSLLDHKKENDQEAEAIRQAFEKHLPLLMQSGVQLILRPESFSYFMESNRRKGRLIKDCRNS